MSALSKNIFVVACVASTAAVAGISGCGELVSGANLKPTVKYKPSTTGVVAADTQTETSAGGETAGAATGVGNLKGKVEFVGPFTTLAPLYQKGGDVKDKDVCAAVEAPNESILVKDGGLANVFIYLRKVAKGGSYAESETKMVFDQKNCVFKPHAMIAPVGKPVTILNSDGVAHNTHAYGQKNVQFNSVVSPNDATGIPLVYKQVEQEPIPVGCDIHPWMKAYHLPIDHPFAAVTAEDGTFEIKNLPVGKHEFKVWHEVGQLLEKSLVVTIQAGDNELKIPVAASRLVK